MCRIGFDLVLRNTLLKDIVLKDEMNHSSDDTTWEDEMNKITSGLVVTMKAQR